ncbi:MAG TPA: SAM-dependent methyltransferase [Ohtaekwangia sp.]|nr:SAM-dependent methyltransferase [Ohtaekwangia sp.]
MSKGRLFLIPNTIADNTQAMVIPLHIRQALPNIRHFFVEDLRTARRYLSSLKIYDSIEPLQFEILDKKSKKESLTPFFKLLDEGQNVGIISESGCPGVADPGALAIQYAHEREIEVVPLVGPSSLLLALMASGLNGQRFAFHGYLPIDQPELVRTIRELERESRQKNQTQLFIETPYRNNSVLKALLANLGTNTLLTIAFDLTGESENVKTHTVGRWKEIKPMLGKMPAVFLFLSA